MGHRVAASLTQVVLYETKAGLSRLLAHPYPTREYTSSVTSQFHETFSASIHDASRDRRERRESWQR